MSHCNTTNAGYRHMKSELGHDVRAGVRRSARAVGLFRRLKTYSMIVPIEDWLRSLGQRDEASTKHTSWDIAKIAARVGVRVSVTRWICC